MAISGLVITLSEHEAERAAALACIAKERALTLGQAHGLRLPAVLESDDRHHYQRCWDALVDLPGVLQVDLVFVDYEASGESDGQRSES